MRNISSLDPLPAVGEPRGLPRRLEPIAPVKQEKKRRKKRTKRTPTTLDGETTRDAATGMTGLSDLHPNSLHVLYRIFSWGGSRRNDVCGAMPPRWSGGIFEIYMF